MPLALPLENPPVLPTTSGWTSAEIMSSASKRRMRRPTMAAKTVGSSGSSRCS
jgi:hypothetical protein